MVSEQVLADGQLDARLGKERLERDGEKPGESDGGKVEVAFRGVQVLAQDERDGDQGREEKEEWRGEPAGTPGGIGRAGEEEDHRCERRGAEWRVAMGDRKRKRRNR